MTPSPTKQFATFARFHKSTKRLKPLEKENHKPPFLKGKNQINELLRKKTHNNHVLVVSSCGSGKTRQIVTPCMLFADTDSVSDSKENNPAEQDPQKEK